MANCCWCDKKLGFWDGDGMSFGVLCQECSQLRDRARRGDRAAADELKKYIDAVSGAAKDELIKLQEMAKTEAEIREEQEEQRKALEEMEQAAQEKINNYLKKANSVMMNTGYNFEGFDIVEYCGIVSAESVVGTGFFSELSLSVNDFFGTTSSTYQSKLAVAKQNVLEKLRFIVTDRGANAIIGIDFDILTLANNAIVVSGNGTAVKIASKK